MTKLVIHFSTENLENKNEGRDIKLIISKVSLIWGKVVIPSMISVAGQDFVQPEV